MKATELVDSIRAGFSDAGGYTGLDSEKAADAFVTAIEPHATHRIVPESLRETPGGLS